jgi:hypothetical protein
VTHVDLGAGAEELGMDAVGPRLSLHAPLMAHPRG